jgi:3-oxoacyl-[acyl-carrier-protein] synthase-3
MFKFEKINVVLGSKKVFNLKIEKLLNYKKGEILKKIGIKNRYESLDFETSEHLAFEAVKNLNFKNVSHLISVTNTSQNIFPGISNYLASKIDDLKKVHCINLNSGCSGFVDALILADHIMKNERKNIIIVTADTYTKYIKRNDRRIRPIFSDGASATLLKYDRMGWKVKKKFTQNSLQTFERLNLKSKYINMDGPAIVQFFVSDVLPVIRDYIKNKKKKIIFCHQAGKVIFDILEKNINKKRDLLVKNYLNYGNLVSTSIPNLIQRNRGKLRLHNNIILSGFGVGLMHSHVYLTK